MHEPRMVHWEGALRVLAYIKRAPGKGLIYRRHDHLRIEAYFDAGDKGDRKSTTGYFTYVGGNLVTWRSRKQKVISCLSAEAKGCDKVLIGVISTPHILSSDQLVDIFTKSIIGVSYDCLGSKLGMFDLYSPA